MGFAERLKEARIAAGLNQKELGALIGVTGNAVSNYENGTSSPNDKILLKIFDALNVDPNFLFQDSFAKEKAPAEQGLSSEQVELLKLFDASDADGRDLLLQFARYTARSNNRAHELTDEERVRAALHRHMLLDSRKENPADREKLSI